MRPPLRWARLWLESSRRLLEGSHRLLTHGHHNVCRAGGVLLVAQFSTLKTSSKSFYPYRGGMGFRD